MHIIRSKRANNVVASCLERICGYDRLCMTLVLRKSYKVHKHPFSNISKEDHEDIAKVWTTFRVIHGGFTRSVTNPLFQLGLMKKSITYASWRICHVSLSLKENTSKLREYYVKMGVNMSCSKAS